MWRIGGNIVAEIERKTAEKDEIGQSVAVWTPVGTVSGWLDYASGQNDIAPLKGKVQDTTHYFLCDYREWMRATRDKGITSETARLRIKTNVYNILLIDDPMEMHRQIEIYLQYIGGGLGV